MDINEIIKRLRNLIIKKLNIDIIRRTRKKYQRKLIKK